ncbi:MAG: hypothetical protein M5R36_22405 [Deltaproteobacteria bacterium]|nr:hypothetical protein [Deltaproteobacteria bacterium]
MHPPETPDHPVLYSATTGALGYYSVEKMHAGVYTGYASAPGHMTGYFFVYVLGDREVCGQNGTLSPVINGDELRIVLQWGDAERPGLASLGAASRVRIDQPLPLVLSGGGIVRRHGVLDVFRADLDDTTSNGPETTTIKDSLDGNAPFPNSPYRFAVQDYTNRSSVTSQAMSNSNGLRVDVLTAAGQQTFYMPPNTPATVWSVFDAEFDGSSWTITAVDDYYFEYDPAYVY